MEFSPNVLYEDAHLIVCVKPAGLLSEPAEGKGFPDLLSAWYRSRNLPDTILTVHRLDRIVGGVMVFARTKEAAGRLTRMVADRKIVKEYLAVLRGVPEQPSATLTDLLFRDAAKNKTYVVKRMRKGVREASLDYETLGEQAGLTLVQVRLHTGRTHQIRVQFASRGTPLLGDIRYGSKDPRCEAALWSHRLAFDHPVTGKPVDVSCDPPAAYPWELFG